MKINLTKVGIAAGVGVVNVAVERSKWGKQETAGMTGHEWVHLLAVLGGYGIGMFLPKYHAIGEVVGIAATPLLVKDLANRFAPAKATSLEEHVLFTPRTVASPSTRGWTPTSPGGATGGYRPMRVTS